MAADNRTGTSGSGDIMEANSLRTGLKGMLVVLFFIMAVLAGAADVEAAKKMPRFSKKNVADGSVVNSDDYKGKVLLVNFWATWCPPCRKEIPYLIRLQEKYREKGFSVIGISLDEGGRRLVNKFISKLKVNYPVILGNTRITRGFGGVIGIPVSFVVDRDGNLVKRLDGYISEKVLEQELSKLFE
jgi:thiol-disulfide isomerase/thioredoxin